MALSMLVWVLSSVRCLISVFPTLTRGIVPDNDSDDEEDEDADTTRTARPRRVSEKEAQRRQSLTFIPTFPTIDASWTGAEKVEAEVRKAAKAAKAAKKQRQPEVEPEPLDDTLVCILFIVLLI